MDAYNFVSNLLDVLPATWAETARPPTTPGAYSDYIFKKLALAAERAGMQYRGYEHGCEVLFDGLWLLGNVSTYRLPQVVIEHENLVGLEDILYDLRKVMMAWAPVRVMIGYAQVNQARRERVQELLERISRTHWLYPSGSEDLILIGRYLMHSPRDYLVLHRPDGESVFSLLNVPGFTTSSSEA